MKHLPKPMPGYSTENSAMKKEMVVDRSGTGARRKICRKLPLIAGNCRLKKSVHTMYLCPQTSAFRPQTPPLGSESSHASPCPTTRSNQVKPSQTWGVWTARLAEAPRRRMALRHPTSHFSPLPSDLCPPPRALPRIISSLGPMAVYPYFLQAACGVGNLL
jgi:hypothetical protein